jgi:hypothetical protein
LDNFEVEVKAAWWKRKRHSEGLDRQYPMKQRLQRGLGAKTASL